MDMPHIVMTKIMGNVGFLAILNLRKTCKTFRNFIDDVKPINDLKELRITLGHFYVKVEVFLDKNGYDADRCSFVSSYQQAPDDNSWLIFKLYNDGVEFVKKMDGGEFIDAFFHDFELILKNQKWLT
ncbi:Protein CBG18651 [Caenorhabditis briggsae]|uniref:Protein CBG18651 n=1 Tax=Caenorhabditis briggsae TaxID=6238 RepID=A8XTT6_CAEBR|nr:Protein CBG18651 [Caenorhabditis briggsae]CAP36062.1 Protein CBG18651 [Caenorhabditis briggsae]